MNNKKVIQEMCWVTNAGNILKDDIDARIHASFETLIDYVDSKMILNDYFKSKHITAEMFSKCMQFIRAYNYEKDGFGTLSKDYVDEFLSIKEKVDYVVSKSKYDNGKRSFDIIDYYMYTDIIPEAFLTFARLFYKGEAIRDIAHIFSTNGNTYFVQDIAKIGLTDETNKILEMSVQFMDSEGKVVAVDNEMKLNIITYLNSIGAPIISRAFLTAARKYINGELDINIKPTQDKKITLR